MWSSVLNKPTDTNMNTEIKTIKLTGHFKNTFKVIPANPLADVAPDYLFDRVFEWDDGKEKTRIPVSLRAANKLSEQFEKFGYAQIPH
jgi:hypothetical protein